ncbi:MAG TPA: DUF1800 domain-containing protein [Sporichthyaceae bacterium]|nr:DUF1800 domain-containing protein [Sporichthyaceae bacterium]
MTTIYPTIADAIEKSAKTAKAPLAWNPTDHVLSRLAFGPTPAARTEIARNGIPAWISAQIAAGHTYAGYTGDPLVAAQATRLGLSPADSFTLLKLGGNKYGWDVMTQLTQTTLGLQVWSKAQLYEVLVDFFTNHLNVVCPRGDLWVTRHTFDRDVIREHAMGSFTDMLLASARNPAMLLYLDLAQSTKSAVNENYARELLELHTVGLVYSEADVKNVAKLLTGRTVSSRTFDYTYNPAIHGTGGVTVLGFRHPNSSTADGEVGGDALLRYLAAHPSTAKRLARKLCIRLVSDRPSHALVTAVATAYLGSGTQILPMLDTILRSEEFWASRGHKVRRPAENVIATMRILEVRPASIGAALKYLQTMTQQVGNQPLAWGPPDGYPDVATAWRSASTLLMLWLHHLGLAADSWTNAFAKSNKTTLYGGTPANSGDAIARLGVRLTGAPLPTAHAAALQTFLAESATTPMARSTLHALLPALVALILDGPSHALR